MTKMKRICVIDGQGGGIGATLIKHIKETYGESVELIGLGTNAIASAQMLKAGANRCASGENAIVQTVTTADLIAGPVSITWPNAMLGEVTQNGRSRNDLPGDESLAAAVSGAGCPCRSGE